MDPPQPGRALLLLGLVAVLGRACPAPAPVPAAVAGEAVTLRWETLAGDRFRLLPGVGPVLAGRLEEARQAAGGALDPASAARVKGVGPVLLRRWAACGLAGERVLR